VTFVARLGDSAPAGGNVSIGFYDGARLLGTGAVRQEGRVRFASITVTTLAVGSHEITAEIRGLSGATSQRTQALRHTVVAPTGR
jgi:ABC-type phosphonate transport system ATPase subunit